MQVWMIIGLWAVYLALTANLEVSNLVVGLLIAMGLTWLLHPEAYRVDLRRLPAATWALLRYALIVIAEIWSGGVRRRLAR